MTEPYEGLGEFHDLFMSAVWERLRPHLHAAFRSLSSQDTLLDLGAGTGVGTRTLSQVTPAQIMAVEPSRTMRAVLLARVADDDEMTRRVSVLADPAPPAVDDVPGPLAGFVCAHMLGHLDAESRIATFRRLAAKMAPHGTGLITLPRVSSEALSDEPADESGEVRHEETVLGRHTYVARHMSSGDRRTATTEYLVMDGDRILREETFAVTWTPPSLDELRDELAHAGMTMAEPSAGLVLVHLPGDVA